MGKNQMKEVAKLLDVEIGTKFNIKGLGCNPCHLEEDGLINCYGHIDPILIYLLLNGEYEIEKSILDDVEKEYLLNIIKPKQIYKQVDYISKHAYGAELYICINLKDENKIMLPTFCDKRMYKGMEFKRRYTLKELGLDIYG